MRDRPLAMTRAPSFEASVGAARMARSGPAGPMPPARRRDEMGTGLAVSAVLHTVALVLMLLGLPNLFKREPPREVAIAVQLLNIAENTRTTKVNPHPKADAKPVEPPPVPVEKPQPPIPDPITPPPAPPPQAKPEPPPPPPPEPLPKPEPKPEPPPPLPIPKPAPLPPPPKPIDLPKPPPEKPEPPKQVAKVEPPKPEKKKDDQDFDKLLNNLAKTPAQEKSDQPAKPQKQPPPTQTASSLANAPLGSQISTSEKDLLAAAVSACWDVDPGAKGASEMRAVIQVEINPDGTVLNTTIVGVEGGDNDAVRRAFAERARRAPLIPACNKLPIPPGKYEQLKVFTFTFSPQGVL
jgi:hypothetical protein